MQRAMQKSFLIAFSLVVLLCTSVGTAYVPSSFKPPKASIPPLTERSRFWQNLVVATAFLTLPIVGGPALAMSETAAQIQLNAVPPSTIQIQIEDLPVIGRLISGTYARVDPNAAALVGRALGSDGEQAQKAASVIIKSPPDKGKAIKDIASSGHLEFGTIFETLPSTVFAFCERRS